VAGIEDPSTNDMKTILILAAICGTVTAQDRSIGELRRQLAQGYHRVDPRTQTQARSGNREAQARLRYQQAQSQAEGDYNSGRTDAYDAEYARQRAAAAYEAEMIRLQRERERELAEIRRQNEELRRIRQEMEQRNSYRR
jgi:hypothetical protein